MAQQNKFYITTPIYYVNARPHIGHSYTTIACDAVARRQRALGFDALASPGTAVPEIRMPDCELML